MSDIVNKRLNYSRDIIKQISRVNNISSELSDILTLAFAGMLSYYGEEAIDELYLAFLKTKFVVSDKSIARCLSEKEGISKETISFILNHTPGVFYDVTGYECVDKNRKRSYKFDRKVYVQNDGNFNKQQLLRGVIHQVNHVLTSMHNSIISSQGKLAARMGMSYDRLQTREASHFYIEEAVNKLQTEDMMSEVYEFGVCEILDDDIRRNVLEVLSIPVEKVKDDEVTAIIRPLYEDDFFNALLVDKRISGRLNSIREEFDFYTEPGDYALLLEACSLVATTKDSDEKEQGREVAKGLVKKYIESGYGDN